jgi:pyruvate,water dikinase
MQKAVAIVTDQGGILSHAAIVARELKKPCIVGTGNATTLLKNGQIVAVNADSGTVEVL